MMGCGGETVRSQRARHGKIGWRPLGMAIGEPGLRKADLRAIVRLVLEPDNGASVT